MSNARYFQLRVKDVYFFSMTVFEAHRNIYDSCTIESAALPLDPAEFAARLEYSIGVWKTEGVKVVWIAVSQTQALLIPLCVAAGFVFHHTAEDTLRMTLTLVPDSYIPPYATHYIGAGGVVIDDNGNILVVSERYKQRPGRHLKLPGGTLQTGEHIAAAVVREVKEETGIQTRFERLVCLRHWHGYRYGKSDIYFVCRLTPLTTQIIMDTQEIAECLWLPLEDYLADTDVHPFNKLAVRAATDSRSGLTERFIPEYSSETHEVLA